MSIEGIQIKSALELPTTCVVVVHASNLIGFLPFFKHATYSFVSSLCCKRNPQDHYGEQMWKLPIYLPHWQFKAAMFCYKELFVPCVLHCVATLTFVPGAVQHFDGASSKWSHEMLSSKTIRYNWTERDLCDGSGYRRKKVYCMSTTPGHF